MTPDGQQREAAARRTRKLRNPGLRTFSVSAATEAVLTAPDRGGAHARNIKRE